MIKANGRNRQEWEMFLYNSLISEDGMIHVDYPITVSKGEVCTPIGEIFEFEDGDTENIACFAVTKSGKVILAAVDGEEAELAQTEDFKPKVFELYFGEATYDELPIEIINEMQSDGIEFNDETGEFYFEDQDHADIWGYPQGVADSKRIKDEYENAEYLDPWELGEQYGVDLDFRTEEQFGRDIWYWQECKTVREVERFNFHSDYWGQAEWYQDAAISIMEEIEPMIGGEIEIPIENEDGSMGGEFYLLKALMIDKKYNSHLCLLVEEV